MNFEVLIITLGCTITYCLLGATLAGITRRGLRGSEREQLDDLLLLYIMIWPVFLVTKPLRMLYGWVSGD